MNQKAIETCIALGAINIDEYNRIEKKLIKYIYDTDIDLRRLLKYFLDTKGLSFIKFTELSKFIIYNDYGEYLDLFYPVLDKFKLINKLDYGRYGFRELMSRLYKKKSIEDNLAFSKLLFVDDNLEITVNKERLRVKRAGISNSDYFSKFKLESLNNNNEDEALFYAYIKNNELVKVHKACENAINETKGLATDKDIGPIILYDNLLFRYKLETSFGVRVRY